MSIYTGQQNKYTRKMLPRLKTKTPTQEMGCTARSLWSDPTSQFAALVPP